MRTSSKQLGIVVGALLLLILLATNAFVVQRRLGIQVKSQFWVLHTQQVLLLVSQTESLIKDAETGQRGFLYTGDSKYLASYESAVSNVNPAIDDLTQLTSDNPRQQARIPKLRSLAGLKLDELAQTIALYKSGRMEEA